jgi:thymidylate synthase (FAD)
MRIIEPSHEIILMPEVDIIPKFIEKVGRTCYKSEDKINSNSAKLFIDKLLRSEHLSVIEHITISVRFICDRGISHELVRHRLASYSQESTRYANYSTNKFGNELTFIKPLFWSEGSSKYSEWLKAMDFSEKVYLRLLKAGALPEQARSVLPNSLKTEIIMSCNIREWRHVLNLRCSLKAHPQMRQIMLPLLKEFFEKIPDFFSDIYEKYKSDI